jgi:hypothetical protein
VTTACPYCLVMLGDAVNAKKASGQAKQELEVIDVAQLLVRSVKLRAPTPELKRSDRLCARPAPRMSQPRAIVCRRWRK